MNATQTAGPKTASDAHFSNSDDRQSHVSISPIQELQLIAEDLHTRLGNPPDPALTVEHAFIYQTARERAGSIQSMFICDLGEIALCHAIVSLSARLLWRANHDDSYRRSAVWHAERAIGIAKRMIDRIKSGRPIKLCREDALDYNILSLSIIRHVFPCISQSTVQDLVEFSHSLCAVLCNEATKVRQNELALIRCEMAEIYRSGKRDRESAELAYMSAKAAQLHLLKLRKQNKPEEARKWEAIQQQIMDRFGIHIKS